MKGDFSRQTFDPKKHYSRVLMQQGRVQVDADWNEQQAIDLHRDATTARDVIGECGAPVDDAGFGITTDGQTLFISRGRMYVNGILCENDQDALDYLDQIKFDLPYRARGQTTTPSVLDLLNGSKASAALVYLDVWQRHLTALDDDLMREKALGGPDTATRTKTVWQVRVLPLSQYGDLTGRINQLKLELAAIDKKIAALQKSKAKSAAAQVNALKATVAEIKKEIVALEEQARQQSFALSCTGKYPEWDNLTAASTGKLNAQTQPPQKEEPCLIPPSAGYTRLENQLYRVEIHNGGTLDQDAVTFKFSRDNGTVVTSVQAISGAQITVHDVGPDAVLGFATGQWVELSDDWLELNGEPGELIRVKDVNAATRIITLEAAPTLPIDLTQDEGGRFVRHPKLRRWDQDGQTGTADGLAAGSGWTDLEGGIQVQFSAGTYKTGDYWLIPARTATGEIEWPPFDVPNTNPVAQAARGIEHHYCRLATVQVTNQAVQVMDDCRNLFPPLTRVCEAATALHVTDTNWRNDDWLSLDQFRKDGLKVYFDTLPDLLSLTGTAIQDSSATMIVSVEVPLAQATTSPDVVAVLDGSISLGTNYVQWTPGQAGNNVLTALARLQSFVRVHITLKGSCIWNSAGDKPLYLDGRALGRRDSLLSDSTKPRIALTFPTGGCEGASDFESWFYLGIQTPPAEAPLQVTAVNLVDAQGQTVTVPLQAVSPQPALAVSNVQRADITFNRAPDPKSIVQNAVFVLPTGATAKTRAPVKGLTVTGSVVHLILESPVYDGTLEVAGSADASLNPPASPVLALDNGSALDGDFNNTAGGNFVLPFYTIG